MNPSKLESALRALYQAGLLLNSSKDMVRAYKPREIELFEDAMQAAKECLEPKEETETDAAFYKRMLERMRCGCVALDCRRHGSYDTADIDRLRKEGIV